MSMASLKSLLRIGVSPAKFYSKIISPTPISRLHLSQINQRAFGSSTGIQLQNLCINSYRHQDKLGNPTSKHCKWIGWQRQCYFGTSGSRMIASDIKATLLRAVSDLHHIKSSPLPPLVVGVGSVMPFLVLPMEMMSAGLYSPSLAFAQVAYGACVLSFVGGVKWGTTIPQGSSATWLNVTYGFAPAVIAWIGVLFPCPLNMLTVMAGLGTAAYFDILWPGYPNWFKAMRFSLTVIAMSSMLLTLICAILLDSEKDIKKHVAGTQTADTQ